MNIFNKLLIISLGTLALSSHAQTITVGDILTKLGAGKVVNIIQGRNQTQNIISNSANNSIQPIIVGDKKDTIFLNNKNQVMLFNMAYFADHNPSKLTGNEILVMLSISENSYPNPALQSLYTVANRIMKESNVFKRQQMEKEIEQLVRPYYQPFRGYSKVATKAVVGTFSQLTISHYDINTKSFFIMSPSSTRSICDADRNAREFLSFMPSYSNIQTSKSVLNDEACYVKVLDQTVAMKVESLISEGKLSNKDIYTLVFSHVEPLQGQPNAYYFKPIQEFLFVDDPNTRKPLIVKSLL